MTKPVTRETVLARAAEAGTDWAAIAALHVAASQPAHAAEIATWVAKVRPDPPPLWRQADVVADGYAFRNRMTGISVLVTVGLELDGHWWMHASAAHPKRQPSYVELAEVKAIFVGADRRALQIFAPRREHVNIHPHCLHLWACLDGDPLPDFTHGTRSI